MAAVPPVLMVTVMGDSDDVASIRACGFKECTSISPIATATVGDSS